MANAETKTKASGRGEKPQARKELKDFESKVHSLKERGFSVLAPSHVTEISTAGASSEARLGSSGMIGGNAIQQTFSLFDDTQSHSQPVEGVGTKGLGYIPWGPGNKLPNLIYSLMASLPYTAAGIKYLIDLKVGLGPTLAYPSVKYANGVVTEELIAYENAGFLLRNRMIELRAKIKEQGEGDAQQPSGKTISWQKATSASSEDEPAPGTLEYELKLLQDDYAEWTRTAKEYEKFKEENDLGLNYLKCMMDDEHMDIYFPTIGLSIGRPNEAWDPKIVKIGNLPCVCTRMEEMDDNMRVNYVYYSERWRGDATIKMQTKDIVHYPTLMPENRLAELRRQVKKNQNASTRRRPTWFCCPTYYPSMFRPYYPQPASWSMFPSKAFDYASTMITDKAAMRQNATMWGKMIFINNEYLRAMFDETGADTPEEKEAIRSKIYNSVNELLKQRENNGKTICLDMFVGPDGKTMQHAVEIVDVPQVSGGKDMKEELAEISSILFFALGVSPELVGAIPGKSSSTGGTYHRELQLLKQNQVSPRQRIYLKFLQDIHTFNRWDKKGVWVVKQQVLTTLDRNKTGTEETESK